MTSPRKGVGEATQQTVRFFETVLRASSDGILITDISQNIVVVNEAFCLFFGQRWRSVIETSLFVWLDQLGAGAPQRWEELQERVAREGSCSDIEFTSTLGGKPQHLSVNASLLDQVGMEESGVIISVWRDVTEQVEAANQLRQYASELEAANADVKRFAYIVSHDLRTPLAGLNLFSHELASAVGVLEPVVRNALLHLPDDDRRAVTVALDEEIPEALEHIGAQTKRLGRFVDALLTLSRMGRQELHLERVPVNEIVQEAVHSLAHQIEASRCQVNVGELPEVVADATVLTQIMDNLIGNAVKYLDQERPGMIEVTAETRVDEALFRVRDNGRGIAPEQRENVFAPFRRAGAVDTDGEGMGLAYVEALVKRHGGRITFESEQGTGTVFTFALPRRSLTTEAV